MRCGVSDCVLPMERSDQILRRTAFGVACKVERGVVGCWAADVHHVNSGASGRQHGRHDNRTAPRARAGRKRNEPKRKGQSRKRPPEVPRRRTTTPGPRDAPSRGHGRSTVNVAFNPPDNQIGADVPQKADVRGVRRSDVYRVYAGIEPQLELQHTPMAMQTWQVKQPRTMSSIATHAPWLGRS